jgi:hypothetical protein
LYFLACVPFCVLFHDLAYPVVRSDADPNLSIPDPGVESTSRNLSIFNPKNCFQTLENMIRDVHPRSGPEFLLIPDQEVKKIPDPKK